LHKKEHKKQAQKLFEGFVPVPAISPFYLGGSRPSIPVEAGLLIQRKTTLVFLDEKFWEDG
jgi:hypothetical protein